MKRYKFEIGFTSILLTFVLLLRFLFPSFPISTSYGVNYINENIRTINTDKIYNTSVEDEIEAFLSQFDEYEYTLGEDPGQIIVRETKYAADVTEIYETYINYLDEEATEFTIVINSYYNNEIIEDERYIVQPYYDEEMDEFYIDFEDELISVSEILDTDFLENCIAIPGELAVAVAVLAVAAVIICYPYIQTIVTTIVTTVVTRIMSFFRWLKNIFVTKTVTRTMITTVVNYQVNVFSRDFVLEKIESDNEPPRSEGTYHLSVVIGLEVYISIEEITESEAVAVLATNSEVTIQDMFFQLNTYTFDETDAENIALQASEYNGRFGVIRHTYHNRNGTKAGVFFEHFHPGAYGTPHSFFGFPQIIL